MYIQTKKMALQKPFPNHLWHMATHESNLGDGSPSFIDFWNNFPNSSPSFKSNGLSLSLQFLLSMPNFTCLLSPRPLCPLPPFTTLLPFSLPCSFHLSFWFLLCRSLSQGGVTTIYSLSIHLCIRSVKLTASKLIFEGYTNAQAADLFQD